MQALPQDTQDRQNPCSKRPDVTLTFAAALRPQTSYAGCMRCSHADHARRTLCRPLVGRATASPPSMRACSLSPPVRSLSMSRSWSSYLVVVTHLPSTYLAVSARSTGTAAGSGREAVHRSCGPQKRAKSSPADAACSMAVDNARCSNNRSHWTLLEPADLLLLVNSEWLVDSSPNVRLAQCNASQEDPIAN